MKKKPWTPRTKTTKIVGYIGGFQPDKFKTKLKWRYHGTASLPSLGTYLLQFSGNSPYDPDYTGVGTTAQLWLWCAQMYNKYMCTYSKIKFRWHLSGSQQNMQIAWIKRSLSQAQLTLPDDYYGNPYGRVRTIVYNNVGEHKPIMFKDKCSTTKILGRKMDPSLDRVANNADPTEEWIYELQAFNEVASAKSFTYDVEITYWVTWSDRENVPA